MPIKLAEANAKKTGGDHIMNHNMVAGAEGARHHVVRGGRRPPLIMWSPLVFWALASASFIGTGLPYFIGFGHFLFFGLWPPFILGASRGPKLIFLTLSCTPCGVGNA